MTKFLLAFFLLAHGLVHPLLAYVPADDDETNIGGKWTNWWLFGDGPTTKSLIWGTSSITALIFALAAISLIGVLPREWFNTLAVLAAGSSLAVLVVFWYSEFILGIVIDLIIIGYIWRETR